MNSYKIEKSFKDILTKLQLKTHNFVNLQIHNS